MKLYNTDIYHIKATCLIDGRDNPYRVVAIEKYKNLTNLAEAILGSFKFGCDHCFGFYDNIKNWTKSKVAYERFVDVEQGYFAKDFAESPNETSIDKVFKDATPMLFLFDYGREWLFTVSLVNKSEIMQDKAYPYVIEEHGKVPKQY